MAPRAPLQARRLAWAMALTLCGCPAPPPPASARAATTPAPPPDPRGASLAAGDQAFAKRDNPAQLREAIRAWSTSLSLADGADVRLRLARAEHFLGWSADAQDAFLRGTDHARRALALQQLPDGDTCGKQARPEHAAAVYWLAENLSGQARGLGIVAGADHRRVALCLASRAAELEPGYHHAAPLRLLGRLLSQAPALAGGSMDASRQAFERAILLAPEAAASRVEYAGSVAVKLQDRKAFDEALEKALDVSLDSPETGPENRLSRRRAEQLRARAGELF